MPELFLRGCDTEDMVSGNFENCARSHGVTHEWGNSVKNDFQQLEYSIYYRPQCIRGHSIFSTAERISSCLVQICSTDKSKSDYSKNRRIRFLLPCQDGLKKHFENIYYWPKVSINRHGLLLRLRETNIAVTAVFERGTIPYHTYQESQPGVVWLRY